MIYTKNHMHCIDSIWGGKTYQCKHVVILEAYQDTDDGKDQIDPDWTNLMSYPDEESGLPPSLRQDVVDWLNRLPPSTDRARRAMPQPWAVRQKPGGELGTIIEYEVFFLRRRDAMRFIRTWSTYGKPILYYDSFTDERKYLVGGELISHKTD